MRRRRPRRGALRDAEGGFTLLELLVTLVLLGLLMATLSQTIQFGRAARQLQGRIDGGTADLETTARVLRRLIAQACPGDPSISESGFNGTPHAASFVTILPDGRGATSTHEADVSLGIAPGHHLVLRWRPHYRRWILTPPPLSTEVLLDGVERLDLGFWRPEPGSGSGAWVSDWSAPDPPELVRLRLVFPDGDARRWPDIIAAPLRAPSWP